MSADNWTVCPRCKVEAMKRQTAKQEKAEESYGKVSAADYLYFLEEARKEEKVSHTLAEYYETEMGEDGDFFVSYRCNCRTCGWNYKFKHEEKVGLEIREPE